MKAQVVNNLGEECGVFGVYGSPDASSLIYYGLHALQHRGQEGAGIAVSDADTIRVKKAKGLVSEVFDDPIRLAKLKGSRGIGHVRYSTSGNNWSCNLQPFVFHMHNGNIALAHNGNLVNSPDLKVELERQGSLFNSNSDSEVLMHLIMREQGSFYERLCAALQRLRGGFSYLIMNDDTMYGIVDPHCLRPLVIGKMKTRGGWVISSESCALDLIGAEFYRDLRGGEIAIITEDGLKIERYCPPADTCVAAMEYIYFARPDSNILGKNVHAVRKQCGMTLAHEQPTPGADIVIGVPNSSLSAASGYAEAAHLPYEMGLVKNQYVTRTFIQPKQSLREKGVLMKLSAVKGIVEGKSVVMVDDSIVRGTTSQRIVKLLKDAGAREVHVRIASPEFIFPSFYGIDVSNSAELISAHMNVEELREHLGADSLGYLSIPGLVASVGLNLPGKYGGLCMDSFAGHYPAGLGSYEQEYLETQTEIQKHFSA